MRRHVLAGLGAVAILAAGWFAASHYHGHPREGVDDAQIFLVYAEHAATGAGIVYNLGGERVEGFTSPAWMALCAAVIAAGGGENALLGIGFALLAIAILALLAAPLGHGRGALAGGPYAWLFLALVASSPGYLTWQGLSLMDNSLWGAALAFVCLGLLRLPGRASAGSVQARALCVLWLAGAACLPLVRPEGIALAPFCAALLFLRRGGAPILAGAPPVRGAVLLALPSVAVAGLLTLARQWYFGQPLPNTFYAKVSPELGHNLREGRAYLYDFLLSSPLHSAAALVAALLVAGWMARAVSAPRGADAQADRGLRGAETLACFAAAGLALPALTGGDHFGMHRFYQPWHPLLCLLLCLAAHRLRALEFACALPEVRTPGARALAWTILAAPFILWLWAAGHGDSWRTVRTASPLHHEFETARTGLEAGARFRAAFAGEEAFPSAAVVTAGGFKRAYPGEVIDLMGLNNPAMARSPGARTGMKNHAAFNAEVFLAQAPDVLIAAPPEPPQTENLFTRVLPGLFAMSKFQREYRFGVLHPPDDAGAPPLTAYWRRTFLDRVLAEGEWRFAAAGD